MEFFSCSKLLMPRTYISPRGGEGTWNAPLPSVFVTLRYFEKFLPLIDSLLILWDAYTNGRLGAVTSSNMAVFFYFYYYNFRFFPENLKSYSENRLVDSLACKRCFNTSLCCFTTTSGSEYGSDSWQHYILIHLKFKATPHLSFNISYIYKPIFTKFTENMPQI